MILHRPNLASFKKIIIATTDRSFKLKQLHFDVTSIVLQSSDHTLKRAINIVLLDNNKKRLTFAVLQLSPLNGSRRSNGTGYNPIASNCA
jgi:hypothetical protein